MPVIQPITSASSGSAYVPTSRTLTINGVTYDLTTDRSWTVEVLDNLIATAPLSYNSGTNTISISQAGSSSDGYLSSIDWLSFSSKQNAITLTTTGNSGAATLVGATLNIPEYTLAGLGGFSNPMTSLGDIIYGNAAGLAVRRAGNTTTTKMFLSQTGDGTSSSAPQWQTAVTSVAVTMPSAFSVSGSPITTTGTIAITGAGSVSQYVRGDGSLANFPTVPGGGGGGRIYYFNGSVSQGTISGITMYELGEEAIYGTATNFTRSTTGNIANFITDAGVPNLTKIPAGVWAVDAYLSETGGGSDHAILYASLEIWDGSTLTTISTSPNKEISDGSFPNIYTFDISVPETTISNTDRIVIQFYISNTNGKTVTLYTQADKIAEVHTTFTTGIGTLNGITEATQYFATGTSGTDFNISSVTDTHTFNLPTASSSNRGLLSTTDWSTFNGKMNNPFTSLGDIVYSNAAGAPIRRAGNITTTKMFLSQTGDGTSSAAPQWSAITSSDTGSVPTSRTLTINDVAFDLSANRSWSVGDYGTW